MELEELINFYSKEVNEVIILLNKKTGINLKSYDIQQALTESLSLKDEFEMLEKKLTCSQMFELLSSFDFKKYYPETLLEINLSETIVPDNTEHRFVEAQFKHKGEIWVVHKNDTDPFPSNPHAHCYEKGLKLHLGSGDLYLGTKHVGKIQKKKFISLRGKMSNITLPDLKL